MEKINNPPSVSWRMHYTNPIKMDKVDRKIISILHQNARMPIADIARFLHLSKAGVLNRIQQLAQKKIIDGYKTHFRLFPGAHYAILLIHSPKIKKKYQQLLEIIAKRPETITVMSFFGSKNLFIGFVYFTQKQKEKYIKFCQNECENETYDYSDIIIYYPMIFDYTNEHVPIHTIIRKRNPFFYQEINQEQSNYKISQIDAAIILLLHQNPRTPIIEIAKTVGTTHYRIRNQIAALTQNGIISKFSANINPYVFGDITYCALWANMLKTNDVKKLEALLKNEKVGNSLIALNGKWNILAFLHFHSHESIHSFEEKLHEKIPSLRDYFIDIVREQVKLEWIPTIIQKRLCRSKRTNNTDFITIT